ncbi:hypothetical protein GOBAR_AA19012 [Gossypium barbadense]|uniref:Uncharacterized protein n=1 Tax=Gossypium barbadense TaxID=3634 RepID=A0A2P5XE95_GOSBA|nr:hypothetical protein GOBAR_AA19012 [Gossypium barbadense]
MSCLGCGLLFWSVSIVLRSVARFLRRALSALLSPRVLLDRGAFLLQFQNPCLRRSCGVLVGRESFRSVGEVLLSCLDSRRVVVLLGFRSFRFVRAKNLLVCRMRNERWSDEWRCGPRMSAAMARDGYVVPTAGPTGLTEARSVVVNHSPTGRGLPRASVPYVVCPSRGWITYVDGRRPRRGASAAREQFVPSLCPCLNGSVGSHRADEPAATGRVRYAYATAYERRFRGHVTDFTPRSKKTRWGIYSADYRRAHLLVLASTGPGALSDPRVRSYPYRSRGAVAVFFELVHRGPCAVVGREKENPRRGRGADAGEVVRCVGLARAFAAAADLESTYFASMQFVIPGAPTGRALCPVCAPGTTDATLRPVSEPPGPIQGWNRIGAGERGFEPCAPGHQPPRHARLITATRARRKLGEVMNGDRVHRPVGRPVVGRVRSGRARPAPQLAAFASRGNHELDALATDFFTAEQSWRLLDKG